jgi:hypothetical protein
MIDKADKVTTAVTTAISAIKGFAKYLLIPTGAIMFAPDEWLIHFRLIIIKDNYGVWVAMLFWVSISIIVIDWIELLFSKIVKKHKQKQAMKTREESLEILNPEEWDIIYRINRYDSYEFDFKRASVAKLTAQNIITRPSTGTIFGFSYTLQPWVRTFLEKNPQIIEQYAERTRQALLEMINELELQHKNDYNSRWEIERKLKKLKEEIEHYEYT